MRTYLLIIILGLFVCSGNVFSAPFLVCDPQSGVETYEVFRDGVLLADGIPAESDGSLHYDLQGITPAEYTFTAKACNIWGCSSLSDPYASPSPVVKPSGLGMIP